MSLGKRELAAQLLARSGAARVLQRLAGGAGLVTILAYHRVFDMGDEAAFPFDPELVSATSADFRWQMEQVLRAGTPITFRRLAEALDGGQELPARPILVTFDDGHRDNFTHALPVLRSLGVPATVFLSTGYVGCPGTFWFDRVAQLLYRAPRGRVEVAAATFMAELDGVASRRVAAGRLLAALKGVPDAARRGALAELEAKLAPAAPAGDQALSGAVTWDEARALAAAGVELGSHTVSHPILTQVDDAALERELVDSRGAIERETAQPVTAIAYPVGGEQAFDGRVAAAAARAGYRFGASYVSGVNERALGERFALRRLHVERYTTRAYFASLLALPRLFA